jgi:putative hydrolase of HD superfamily
MKSTTEVLLSFLQYVDHLKRLPRTGWLFAGVANPESVADHTSGTALLALVLGDMINASPTDHGLDRPLVMELLLRMALLHDLPESIITDLPKRATLALSKESKRSAEIAALQDIVDGLPAHEQYCKLVADYSDELSPEARLLKDVDKLEMIHQALQYERQGHRNLNEFWQTHQWHYAISQKLFVAMTKERLFAD